MNYSQLKDYLKEKNVSVEQFSTEMEVTRQGLQKMFDNETTSLKLLKRAAKFLNVSPLVFFENEDTKKFNNENVTDTMNLLLESKNNEIKLLNERLSDKDQIISLLRNSAGHGMYAAEPK